MRYSIDKKRIPWLIFYIVIGFTLINLIILLKEGINPFSWDFFLFLLSLVIIIVLLFSVVWIFILINMLLLLISDSSFLDNYLVFFIRKNKELWRSITIITLLIFITYSLIFIMLIYFGSEDKFGSLVIIGGFIWLLLFAAFTIEISSFCQAFFNKPPKLEGLLATEITPELIASDPESAIRKAFTLFEESLKDKTGKKDKNISNLIGQAYNNKDGSILTHENSEAVSNLMRGAYGLYRNDLVHNDKKYSLQQAHYILMLVDDLVKRLDESELRQSDSPSDN